MMPAEKKPSKIKVRQGAKRMTGPLKPLAARNELGQIAPFVPTEEQRRKVENLVAADFTRVEIAAAMKIAEATLERHFREELVGGRNTVHTDIAHGILEGARQGDRTLQIYTSKARLGWSERSVTIAAQQPGLFTINISGGS